MRTTDGTSAQFWKKSSPDAIVRDADHPPAVRDANFRIECPWTLSNQLSTTPRLDAVRNGCALAGPAGDSTGCTVGAHAEGSGAGGFAGPPHDRNAASADIAETAAIVFLMIRSQL